MDGVLEDRCKNYRRLNTSVSDRFLERREKGGQIRVWMDATCPETCMNLKK